MRKLVLIFTWLFCVFAFVSAQTKQVTSTVYPAEDGESFSGGVFQLKSIALRTISILDESIYFNYPKK